MAATFFGDAMEPEKPKAQVAAAAFDPASYDAKKFDGFVGRYALDANPDVVLTFTREGDSLFTQVTGQPRVPIVPRSDSLFALVKVEASVTFHRAAAGKVEGLTMRQGGQELHATRLTEARAAWKPTAADLGQFVGRYFSEELETFYTIALEHDTLVVRHRPLRPERLSLVVRRPGHQPALVATASARPGAHRPSPAAPRPDRASVPPPA